MPVVVRFEKRRLGRWSVDVSLAATAKERYPVRANTLVERVHEVPIGVLEVVRSKIERER